MTREKNGRIIKIDIEKAIEMLQNFADEENGKIECTLDHLIEEYLSVKKGVLSPHTIMDYSLTFRRLKEYLTPGKQVSEITPADIRGFLAQIPGGKKTHKNAHIGLSALWTYAIDSHCVKEHVVKKVEIAKPEIRAIIPFTREEVERMLQSVHRTGREQKRNTAIIKVLLDTGIRASELCGLRLSDVEGEFLRVLGKGGKERRVPISALAMSALLEYMESSQAQKRTSPVFYSETGLPLDRNALRLLINRIAQRSKVYNAHPHKFRHTFALNYLLNGGDPYTLQMILGHSTMDMVKRYLNLTSKEVLSVHKRASPLKNWNL